MATFLDDPNQVGLLSLGLRLMSTPGKFGTALGQSGLGAMGDMQQAKQAQAAAKQRAAQEQLLKMQMEQMLAQQAAAKKQAERQQQIEGAYRGAFVSPDVGGEGPPEEPRFSQDALIRNLMPFDPMTAATMSQPKPRKLTTVAPGASVIDEANPSKPLFTAPDKASAPAPTQLAKLIQERDMLPQWHPNRALYDQEIRKMTTHAPGTTVNVNAEKPLLNTVAQGLGKQIDDSLAVAKSAIPAIQTAQTLRAAVDSGKLVSGPGASFRVLGLQVGQMLGVGGKDGAEILANTRTAIQSMAQAELSAAQQMRGQGQITEAERAIIRRAAAGDINELTAPELRLLSGVMEKTARFKIEQHKKNVTGLSKMQGAEALLPFYQIDEPAQYAPPSAGTRRYNPATGRIE